MTAHIQVKGNKNIEEITTLKQQLKKTLHQENIHHIILEFENELEKGDHPGC